MNVNGLNIVVQILYQNFKRIRPNKKSRPKKQTSRFAQKLYKKLLVRAGYMFPGTGTLGRKGGVGWVCYVHVYEADFVHGYCCNN